MLSDSTANQFGENVHEIFIRKGNEQYHKGGWHSIPDTTDETLCLFYQTRFLGSWDDEVLMAKALIEGACMHAHENGKTATQLVITVTDSNGYIIGFDISIREPLNTHLHLVLVQRIF